MQGFSWRVRIGSKLLSKEAILNDKQRIIFFKQLAVILNSGVPLLKGLALLRQRADPNIGSICVKLIRSLKAGMSLATAMQNCGDTFPNLAITLVAAGERSGELNNVFLEIATYYAKQRELKQFLLKATLYPLFLLTASLGVLCFFLVYVLPMLAMVYQSLGARPGSILQLAVTVSNFLVVHSRELSLLLLISLLYAYSRQQALARFGLRLPMVRGLYAMLLEIRFCKLLGLLLDKGISITEAVDIVIITIGQRERARQLKIFNAALRSGEAISLAVSASKNVFSPLTAELISIGAETGYLPQMLNEAAVILEQDLRNRLEKARELLSPLLLLVAALITAVVVCSVVSPLFELFTALPEYN
ncbi:MAG: type II secretion system F family protein [Phascolarctobacterium sp.]|nr:type II secretion system F family protein [Phascolarctobacterium sp.]MBQ8418705.1 type II secretion system F family protein [Phascolarctobacterium sp.]